MKLHHTFFISYPIIISIKRIITTDLVTATISALFLYLPLASALNNPQVKIKPSPPILPYITVYIQNKTNLNGNMTMVGLDFKTQVAKSVLIKAKGLATLVPSNPQSSEHTYIAFFTPNDPGTFLFCNYEHARKQKLMVCVDCILPPTPNVIDIKIIEVSSDGGTLICSCDDDRACIQQHSRLSTASTTP